MLFETFANCYIINSGHLFLFEKEDNYQPIIICHCLHNSVFLQLLLCYYKYRGIYLSNTIIRSL